MAEEIPSSLVDLLHDEKKFNETINSIVKKIRNFENDIIPKTSIYNVPTKPAIRDINTPHFVSVGPIHDGRPDLLAMEEIKLWYAMFFLYRSINPFETLKECGEAIIDINNVREYYAHNLDAFNKYQLMKILLVDGCFLLELFFRHSGEREYSYLKDNRITKYGHETESVSDDFILGNTWMRRVVCQDLALVNNQIPLEVLEALHSKIKPFLKYKNDCVKDFSLRFFSLNSNICIRREEPMTEKKVWMREEPRHILEMLHMGLRPSWELENGKKWYRLMYCATKLSESGVSIIKNIDLTKECDYFNGHLLEIKFDSRKGILKVPQFWMGGTTSLIIKNLVAFEQHSFRNFQSHHVSAYVMFMKSLIHSEHDLKLLKQIGIIKIHQGNRSDSNELYFFDECCEGVALKDFYFSEVCEEVEEYANKSIHLQNIMNRVQDRGRRYRTVLAAQYCPDACRTIAFVAATIFLLFSSLQTFYTIYPYYHK